jgi:hypothetical protein
MRKTLYILLVVVGLSVILTGCKKSKPEPPIIGQIVGEWHLVSWNALPPENFDAYVTFSADKTFEIYQQIEQIGYQTFTGTYVITGEGKLSGKYSDNTEWGSTYEVSIDATANTLTMVSDPSVGEISVYNRVPVPESVKEAVTAGKSTRTAGRRLF